MLLGEDVGAQLVAQAAVEERVSGIALVGGVYTQPMGEPRAPALVIHGGADGEAPVAEARAFCDAAAARQLPCRLDVVAGASHRVENWWPSQWGYKARLTEWLRRGSGRRHAGTHLHATAGARGVSPGLHKRVIYNTETGQTLDAFVPPGPGPHVPVLLVHGGGWEAGDRVTYVTPMFQPLADAGVAWFSMDYRLTPDVTHAQQQQDLRNAIAFLRERAGSFNIDTRRLVMVGESASGEMVASNWRGGRALAGVVSFYGVYDFVPMADQPDPAIGRDAPVRHHRLDDRRARQLVRTHPSARARDQPPLPPHPRHRRRLWDRGRDGGAPAAHRRASQMLALDGRRTAWRTGKASRSGSTTRRASSSGSRRSRRAAAPSTVTSRSSGIGVPNGCVGWRTRAFAVLPDVYRCDRSATCRFDGSRGHPRDPVIVNRQSSSANL